MSLSGKMLRHHFPSCWTRASKLDIKRDVVEAEPHKEQVSHIPKRLATSVQKDHARQVIYW